MALRQERLPGRSGCRGRPTGRDDIQLLTDAQLAERWQLSRGTLANQRSQGRSPAYQKIEGRVRYRRSDIEAFSRSVLHE